MTASPDAQPIGTVLRKLFEDLFHLRQRYILALADKREVLSDGKERLPLVKLEEPRVVAADADETPARGCHRGKLDDLGLGQPFAIPQLGNHPVTADFGWRKASFPDRLAQGIHPRRHTAGFRNRLPFVLLEEKGGQL